MRFTELALSGAFVIDIESRNDDRGFFARTFCEDEFTQLGLDSSIVQQSISFNERRATVRGLHYQIAPHAEAKTIRCTAGLVYDVIIDLRGDSLTYGQWRAVELSAANRRALYVPAGFAHGFQTLVDDTELLYQMSTRYVSQAVRGLRWDDEALGIDWPIRHGVTISPKDIGLPGLRSLRAERGG